MKHKPYRFLIFLGLRCLQPIVTLLPRRAALALARVTAWLVFFLLGREREKTLRHLTWAYGEEKSPAEIYKVGENVFKHFAQMGTDVLRFSELNRQELDRIVDIGDGFSRYEKLLAEGKGVILLTAHFGNWELMGALFRFHGFPGVVIGRQIYYERYNQAILDLRGKVTLRTIYQDASPWEFLKVLKQNQILGVLADQDMDRAEGIFVPFFGRPAYTVTAPVKLALASGAPIVPTFLVREGEGYRFLVEEPIRVETNGTREETLREYTARWSRVLEEKIRAYPDQWAWMHRRWKTTPESVEARQTPLAAVR